MYFLNIVLTATCCAVINFVFIDSQGHEGPEDEKSFEDTSISPTDHHTFVALIDVMFTDGTKRTCTGTIIHDNVVITAAHCFYSKENKNTRPELTASFVVIGTKHSFETGYEQYLPIEKIVTHPKFKDWTADLALVFTFAGMTSDKPGTVLPLAGGRTSTPVDSNVTVISWGHFADDDESPDCDDTIQSAKMESFTLAAPLRALEDSIEDKITASLSIASNLRQSKSNRKLTKIVKQPLISLREKIPRDKALKQFHVGFKEFKQQTQDKSISKKFQSKYLNIAEDEEVALLKKNKQPHYNGQRIRMDINKSNIEKGGPILRANGNHKNKEILHSKRVLSRDGEYFDKYNMKSYYKNWRRLMGPQQNKLTVETFGFINMNTCNRYLEYTESSKYESAGTNDIVCYSTEGHHVTDKDSGAPAVRQGRLVAVTIGGISYDGENIAIGMKMNCYCSWIVNNLPHGHSYVNCCKNCCDMKHSDKDPTYKF